MAEPLPPVGFIRLVDAFDTFVFGMLGKAPNPSMGTGGPYVGYQDGGGFAAQQDELSNEFVAQLPRIGYKGRVIAPDNSEHALTGDCIERTNFPTLLLFHRAIPLGTIGPLSNYVGGLISLDGKVFFEWLDHRVRTHLHGEIQDGKLEISDGEERMKTLKLLPLNTNPNPLDFFSKVEAEPFWNLPMTVAWIATRRILAVVEQHEPYATRCGHWRASTVSGQVKSGWIWEHCDRPTLSRMMLGEAFNENELESEFLTIRQSRIELWSELKTGNIKATGKLGNNERTAIDAHLWQDLQLGSSGKKRDYVHPTNNLNPNSVWNHVTFSRDAVMKRFPANPADFQQADLKAVGTVVSSSKMPKLEIAKLAISTLWPDSVPTTMTAKKRDADILSWCKSNGKEKPSPRTIRSALQTN